MCFLLYHHQLIRTNFKLSASQPEPFYLSSRSPSSSFSSTLQQPPSPKLSPFHHRHWRNTTSSTNNTRKHWSVHARRSRSTTNRSFTSTTLSIRFVQVSTLATSGYCALILFLIAIWSTISEREVALYFKHCDRCVSWPKSRFRSVSNSSTIPITLLSLRCQRIFSDHKQKQSFSSSSPRRQTTLSCPFGWSAIRHKSTH